MKKGLQIPKEAELLICRLNENGYEGYFVGGCVRDILLNIEPKDWDIATSAEPEMVMSIFYDKKVVETGLKHGTVTVFENNISFEITTYREESEYRDFRRPIDVVYITSLKQDLARRDFTINAMAMDKNRKIIDFYGGREDLKKGRIKTVGKAEERFTEDALRILRMYRFSARLEFEIEKETLGAAVELRKLINHIANERITMEFEGILLSSNPSMVLNLMYEQGVIQTALRLENYLDSARKKIDFSSIDRIKNLKKNYILRLTMFYYNIFFKSFIENDFDLSVLKTFMKRMSYSKKIIKSTIDIITIKDQVISNFCKKTINYHLRRLVSIYGIETINNAFEFNIALYNEEAIIKKIEENRIIFNNIIKNNEIFTLKELNIGGEYLIENNLASGKEIGEILNYLLDRVHIDPSVNNKEMLLKLAEEYKKY